MSNLRNATTTIPHPRRRNLRIVGIALGGIALTTAVIYLGLRYVAQPSFPRLYNEQLPVGATDTLGVADPREALTFARMKTDGGTAVLAVTSYGGGNVTGVPLVDAEGVAYADALTAYDELGYDAIAELAAQPGEVSVPAAQLATALSGDFSSVAVGTNYKDHADETSVEEVFLFAKRVTPTPSRGTLAVGSGLLDYEGELALVPLRDLHAGEPSPASMGLILANDFTDRQLLLEQSDPNNIASGQGFTNAKSQPGFLPIGDLFVIPRDWQAFHRDLQFELYVDGQLRQRATPMDLIWDADTILEEIFAAGDRTFDHDGTPVTVTDEVGTIPRGTLILTGTPAGVIFRPPGTRQITLGVLEYGASFGTNADSVIDSAINVYVREAANSKAYLQANQQVVTRSDRLGQIVIDIVEGDRPDREQTLALAK